jgi:hypothetical protein
MAWYLNLNNLQQTAKPDNEWWTHYYNPGAQVPVSGIYKCRHCKREVTSNQGDPFPSQNHHQHLNAFRCHAPARRPNANYGESTQSTV